MATSTMTSPTHAASTSPRRAAAELGTLLGVWAHPDDECYLASGLMAMAAAAGNRVVVVTATRGERGTADPAIWSTERLADVRTAEMATAMRHLRINDHRWLDHPDGGCADVDPEIASTEIGAIVEQLRPDTVVTFGPDGVTGHPDHIAVGAWVRLALRRSGEPCRLLWPATTTARAERFNAVLDGAGVWEESGPALTPERDVSVSLPLPADVLDAKVAALRAHESQTAPLIEHMGAATYRDWVSLEQFRDGELLDD
jgi:LmbE family N-acetylglucosaminyl deacetylase